MHTHHPGRLAWRPYAIAGVVALAVALIEIWGSEESLSLALFADAWHVLSHLAIYSVAGYAAVLKSRNPALALEIDNRYGAINSWVLVAVAIFLALGAAYRFAAPSAIDDGKLLPFALAGLAGNVVEGLVLVVFGIDHDHGEHRDESRFTALLHIVLDAVGSLVIIGTVGLRRALPDEGAWREVAVRLDPLATLIICALLLWWAHEVRRRIRRRKT